MDKLLKDRRSLLVQVSGTERFVADEKFREKEETDGVFIARLGPVFKKYYIDKVERDVPDTELSVFDVQEDPCHSSIVARLGGKRVVQTSLAHLWSLLKDNEGEGDVLVTDGCANIFYIPDVFDTFWTVSANWDPRTGGWRVKAFFLNCPTGWYDGYRVFCCG